MTNIERGLASRLLVVLCCSSIVSGRTYQTQPLIFALRNYYGQPSRVASAKTERNVAAQPDDEDDEDEYEDEEDDYEPPRIVFKPLIVVLLEGLMSAGKSLRPGARAQSYEDEEEDDDDDDEEEDKGESSSIFKDALALPFKLLQQYGMSALSSYFPVIEQLKTYGKFYENLTRGTKTDDAANQLKEGVKDMTEKLRKGSKKSAINGPRPSTYERFGQYFPYAIITVKLASYFVPGLGQAKMALVGLEVIRISWKTASMYNNGDSFYDLVQGLGREVFTAFVGRRAELEPLQSPSTQTAFVDLSSMDVDTFVALAKESDYPPLKDSDEAALREDIANVVNSYLGDEGLTAEQKSQVIDTIETAAKFIALHAIIPALAKTSGSADPE